MKKSYQGQPRKVMAGILVTATLLLGGCLGMPQSVKPVTGFELHRYLGQWHEIARLDHSFERGLDQVTAEYVMRDDGGVSVINRGYSAQDQAWQSAEGRAYFVDEPTVGHLKVAFFGPFYASYVIFELDQQNYDYAFVSGPDLSYLWLLSRSPEVQPEIYAHFVATANQLGFDTDALIVVKQE